MQFRDADSYQNPRGSPHVDAQSIVEKIRYDFTEANRNFRSLRQRESRIKESDEPSEINSLIHDIQTETDKLTRNAGILRNQLPAAIQRQRETFLRDRLNREAMQLSKELQSLTSQYQKLSSSASRKARARPQRKTRRDKKIDEIDQVDSNPLLMNTMYEFDAAILEEREQKITDITSSLAQVHEAMGDLAILVEEQDEGIVTIENTTEDAHSKTEAGVKELLQAEKHQKGYRKWIIIFLLVIVLGAGGIATYFILRGRQ